MYKFLIALLLFVPLKHYGQITGYVTAVADGDTFTMQVDGNKVKVRLYGIDCPEKSQEYGMRSKRYTTELIYHKTVRVVTSGKDKYQRTIGIVSLDGMNVNEKILAAGMAWHYTTYDKNKEWQEMEGKARTNRIGLWSGDHPVAPWDYRKLRKKTSK